MEKYYIVVMMMYYILISACLYRSPSWTKSAIWVCFLTQFTTERKSNCGVINRYLSYPSEENLCLYGCSLCIKCVCESVVCLFLSVSCLWQVMRSDSVLFCLCGSLSVRFSVCLCPPMFFSSEQTGTINI